MQQALHICICFFLTVFSLDHSKLCQVGCDHRWTASYRFLQRCMIASKFQLWLGHSRTFIESSLSPSCIVLAVCVGLLSCWKVNFQPSLRFWALWTRFSLRLSLYLAAFSFPSSLITSPVPVAEKHPHCMMLPPPCNGIMQVISGAWFPSDMNKELRFIRPENLFFIVWVLFGCIFVNSNQGFMYLYWGEAWVWSLCHQAQIGGVSRDVCPSVSFSHLHIRSWSSTSVTISVLITSLTKTLLLRLLSLARRLDLGRVLIALKSWLQTSSIKDYGGQMLLWTFNTAYFFVVFPRSVSTLSCLSALQAIPLTSGLSFCSDIHFSC